jgi:hypothetical protein
MSAGVTFDEGRLLEWTLPAEDLNSDNDSDDA